MGHRPPRGAFRSRNVARRRRGGTLLELVAASVIAAMVLLPTLRMLRESMQANRDLELRQLLNTRAESLVDEELAWAAHVFRDRTHRGSLAGEGYSDVLFRVDSSQQTTKGGIPGRLLAVEAVVWHDRNGNTDWDNGEPRVQVATKLSRKTT